MTSVWGKKSLDDGLLVQTYLLGDRISVKVVVEVRRRPTSMIKLRVLFSHLESWSNGISTDC